MIRKRRLPITLSVVSTVFLTVGWIAGPFPIFIMIGLAGLFGLYDYFKNERKGGAWYELFPYLLLAIGLSFALKRMAAEFSVDVQYFAEAISYGTFVSLAFMAYWYVDDVIKNRIGIFTVVFFWLALDYIDIKYWIFEGEYFLAHGLDSWQPLTGWSRYTGYEGNLVVMLVGAIGFYYALFKDQAILKGILRWRSLILLTIVMLAVFWIGYAINNNDPSQTISFTDLESLYSGQSTSTPIKNAEYSNHGEFLARTGGWVSVLLLILASVKRITNLKS